MAIHDYRARDGSDSGQVHYASPQQPAVPRALRSEVAGPGRILSRLPIARLLPPTPPRDVPDGGLLPHQLLTAYNAKP